MQAPFRCRRKQFARALAVDHVNIVIINVRFQCASQLLPFRFWHGNIVLDINGIQHLTAKTLAHQTGTNAFTCGVNCRCRPRRAGTDNQYVVSVTLIQLFRRPFFCAGIHFGDDFRQRHTSLTEFVTVQVHSRNAHHITIGDFILECAAVNRGMFDTRVQHRHQVQRLYDVRAVVAGERVISFKLEIAVDIADLLQQRLRLFRRMAASPQQRQHQRGKFMPQRRTRKARPLVRTWVCYQERRLAHRQAVIFFKCDFL